MPSGLTNEKADDVGRELGTRWRLSARECTVGLPVIAGP